jgi:hypothetical protein
LGWHWVKPADPKDLVQTADPTISGYHSGAWIQHGEMFDRLIILQQPGQLICFRIIFVFGGPAFAIRKDQDDADDHCTPQT